jgi:glycosyltransferase involved in cell wall biosynthesis
MLIGIDASRATLPQPTGTEHYSWRLIHALVALCQGPRAEHHFRLYTREAPPPGSLPTGSGVESVIIPFPRLWTHIRLSAEMLLRRPDVLYVPAHVLPLIHPRRSVVTIHDLGYLFYPDAHQPAERVYLERSTRWNARVATRVITISAATRDDLISAYGVDPARVIVVYPGVNEEVRRVDDPAQIAAVRARYRLPERYLLYVGTLQPRKNLIRLVRAYADLLRDQPRSGTMSQYASQSVSETVSEPASRSLPQSVSLVLAGKRGWLYDTLFAEVSNLGLEQHVHFTGYVEQADLAALISGADAFVYPSLYEGFGFPILEAMACGVPVVCARSSCLPEVGGDACLLVDPHDEADLARALTRVLSDAQLRAELIERGYRRTAGFTWERCARETLAVLEAP